LIGLHIVNNLIFSKIEMNKQNWMRLEESYRS